MKQLLSTSALLAVAFVSSAPAQSTIYGLDLRNGGRIFTTDTQDFVGNFSAIGPNVLELFAMDFDAPATTLWVVYSPAAPAGPVYGTINLTNGMFMPVASLAGPASVSGLTADPDGVTWYMSEIISGPIGSMRLWRGDITTGTFTVVGTANNSGLIVDIAMDSQGNLYGNNISDDLLYSIDPNTAAIAPLGPTGYATNFAQGMDFDWSTDTLYATLYTGGGTGAFVRLNTTTGAATLIANTVSLNAEMEIALQVPAPPVVIGTNYCAANMNSTGNAGQMSASGSDVAANADLTLTASSLPNGSFGFFITSQQQGFVANAGGSAGNICLGQSIGRYVAQGQIRNSGVLGAFSLAIPFSQTPTPSGLVTIMAGDTWNFQAWFRDAVQGVPTSNFTDGLEVLFH